jgi:hypothetical protein
MRKRVTLPVFILLSVNCIGQDYVIKYDMAKEKIGYYKIEKSDTSQVKRISLKSNSRVSVQVDNFNPFYYNARVTTLRQPVEDGDNGESVFNPFSVLASGMGDVFSKVLPTLDLPNMGSRSAGEPAEIHQAFKYWAIEYENTYKRLVDFDRRLKELQMVNAALTQLKFSVKKDEASIRNEATTLVNQYFGTDRLTVQTILNAGTGMDQALYNVLDSAQDIQEKLARIATDPTFNKEESIGNLSYAQIAEKILALQPKINTLLKADNNTPNVFLTTLRDIANTHTQIMNTEFRYRYSLSAAPDLTGIKLEMFTREDSTKQDTVVRYFHVQPRSVMRLRNSLGISFTRVQGNNKAYYVDANSNTIGVEKADAFVPVISTFLHFYGSGEKKFKWGGAFGFGIPVQGENKEINFQAGLSFILGYNEPVIISFGASGTRTKQIDEGYKVGDAVAPGFVIPYRSSYKIGPFLALTFNLSGINKK